MTNKIPSVLLPNAPLPSISPTTVFIIDWELSSLGLPETDLGQMIAELYELNHFKAIDAGIWLIEAFMQGYGKISEELAFRVAIHAGAHLLYFGPRVKGWGSKEQLEELVRVGRDWIVRGWGRDRAFFEEGVLGCLLA